MNLKGLLVAVAMIGSASAMGCAPASSASSESADIFADSSEASAPETSNWFVGYHWGTRPAVARTAVARYSYVRVAPPVARYHVVGHAPSARHFWVNGYYRWTGAKYAYVGGRWEAHRPGYAYVPGRWTHVGGYYHWVPATWRRA